MGTHTHTDSQGENITAVAAFNYHYVLLTTATVTKVNRDFFSKLTPEKIEGFHCFSL